MIHQDTGKKREQLHDAFFTPISTAQECATIAKQYIPFTPDTYFIEPSAGCGNFIQGWQNIWSIHKKNLVALDIRPECDTILTADFLQWKPPSNIEKWVVFGNPPFGKQASMAKKFIRHSCSFASYIAFILPLSFQKPSMQKCFPLSWKCLYSQPLENNEFIINQTKKHIVPCIFQIWKYEKGFERIVPNNINNLVKFVKPHEEYDLCVRRVGVNAGRTHLAKDSRELNSNTHNYIKFIEKREEDELSDIMNKMNQLDIQQNTTGPKSISQIEIIHLIEKLINIE
jgi:hypothetical protein